ncbi:MAG: DUF1566 domain-containing protein, partial [Deltaproteobacteria bacterium]|nr:DUF1566 domain-containing protein [Deltaproteobacteria bacterium]
SRCDEAKIVTDSTTTLQWQDDETVKNETRTWTASISYCEDTLSLGGLDDWRLPNNKELLSITDYTRLNPAIDDTVFIHTALSKYWSSTTYAHSSKKAWFMTFTVGARGYMDKSSEFYVRCVRGGKFGDLICPEGQYLKQGERVCIPGTADTDPGAYPLIADRNYIQGDINSAPDRIEDLGWLDPYPLLCPPGQIRGQQGAGCIVKPVKDPCEPQEGMAALPIDCWEPQPKIEPKDIDGDAHLL